MEVVPGCTSLGEPCFLGSSDSRRLIVDCLDRSTNKMPAGVRAAIRDAAREHGKLSEGEAADFIGTLEREGRLFEECWS